jgi:hypothetical protein
MLITSTPNSNGSNSFNTLCATDVLPVPTGPINKTGRCFLINPETR